MCPLVKKVHLRTLGMKDHNVVKLSEINSSATTRIAVLKCPVHKDEYRYFDKQCEKAICRDCFALDHVGHTCQTLEQAAVNCKPQLDELERQARQHVVEIEKALKDVASVKGQVGVAVGRTREKIVASFNKVIDTFTLSFLFLFCLFSHINKPTATTRRQQTRGGDALGTPAN